MSVLKLARHCPQYTFPINIAIVKRFPDGTSIIARQPHSRRFDTLQFTYTHPEEFIARLELLPGLPG